jgi:hypothetical protein
MSTESYLDNYHQLQGRPDVPGSGCTYKLSDVRYLNTIIPIVTDQLARYTNAITDVITYAMSAMATTEYIEPLPTYSKDILYSQLYEELKTIPLM